MNSNFLGGAINPYALAETVIGKRVEWNKLERPLELLEKTLGTRADRLFDGGKGSPVFALQQSLLSPAARPGRTAKSARAATAKTPAKARNGTAAALPAFKANLSEQISPALRKHLVDIVTPVLIPQLRTTEYSGATWSDPGDFFEEGTEFGDPVQGAVGDCWLIAALASVALSRPYAIVQRNRTTGPGNDAFVNAIDIADTSATTKRFEVTENVPVNTGTGAPRFARSAEAGEIWPGVYEKAFAKFRSGNLTDKPDILVLHGGDCVDASARLVPGTVAHYTQTSTSSADALWQQLRDNCIATPTAAGALEPVFGRLRSGRTINPMTAWTYATAADAPDPIAYDGSTGIVGWHCYSILGWITRTSLPVVFGQPARTQRYIVLRNPWGQHEGLVDTLAADWRSHETSWIRATPLNTGGVFAMTIESFKRYFAGLGVAS
ncbi:C2 family cysteine protease [Luteimonas aquatica]|uniref:C2 family cysteine protease n=1 Tax=Luteimonas aquatica TaxID=450364 RepID=UPI001F5A9CA2|nr:C2 family cysteine protease [Luteimonas aquatica]